MKNTVLKLLVATLIISAVLGITLVVLNLWNDVTLSVLLSTFCIFAFSVPGLCCSLALEKKEYEGIAKLGMIVCTFTCIYIILEIWELLPMLTEDFGIRSILSLIIISFSFGHFCLLSSMKSDSENVKYIRMGTFIIGAILDIFLLADVIFDLTIEWRILSVLIILVTLGTILIPIVSRINGTSKPKEDKFDELAKLKKLLDNKAITQEEYDKEKEKILNK